MKPNTCTQTHNMNTHADRSDVTTYFLRDDTERQEVVVLVALLLY